MWVGRTCTADDVVVVLMALVAARGEPQHLRMDNGPEMIAWALRDYCRLTGTRTSFIEPGSPWENPFVESFNNRVRDELLNVEEFATLLEAQVLVEAWRTEYNTYRPHSSLGDLTPTEYAASWRSQSQTALSPDGPQHGIPSASSPPKRILVLDADAEVAGRLVRDSCVSQEIGQGMVVK
jgi:putative transposase